MEKIKEPSTMTALIVGAGLVANTAYFYKKHEALDTRLLQMQETINNLTKAVKELQGAKPDEKEFIKNLDSDIKWLKAQMFEIKRLDSDIEELTKVLDTKDIKFARHRQFRQPIHQPQHSYYEEIQPQYHQYQPQPAYNHRQPQPSVEMLNSILNTPQSQ